MPRRVALVVEKSGHKALPRSERRADDSEAFPKEGPLI
jgi:hypothetical protein